jgi:hypothetical protein
VREADPSPGPAYGTAFQPPLQKTGAFKPVISVKVGSS